MARPRRLNRAAGSRALTPFTQFVVLPLVGVVAGTLGGMFGVGGGLIMIPALLLLLHEPWGPDSIHVYKLASLATSVVVSIPAAMQQWRVGNVAPRILTASIPLSVVGILAGVWLASLMTRENAHLMRQVFGSAMILAATSNLLRMWLAKRAASIPVSPQPPDGPRPPDRTRPPNGPQPPDEPRPPSVAVAVAQHASTARERPLACPVPRLWSAYGPLVGAPAGLVSGLLGIGGGLWAVPAQAGFFRVHLPHAIANSTCMVIFIAAMAALAQSAALQAMPGVRAADGWFLALCLTPGGLLGGWIGAWVTQRMPLTALRVAFNVLIGVTGARLLIG